MASRYWRETGTTPFFSAFINHLPDSRRGGFFMTGRGSIAGGVFFTFLGLVAIVWYLLGNNVPVLTGSSLSYAGVFAVVVGYFLTVGGFMAVVGEKRRTINRDEINEAAVERTIRLEHPGPK